MSKNTTDQTIEQPTEDQQMTPPTDNPQEPVGTVQEEQSEREETGNKAAAEAKKYRLKLRETEAALAAANARVETLQTTEVERLAAEAGIVKPAAIWLSGMSLEAVRDENGNINIETAKEHIQAAQENLGLSVKKATPPFPDQHPNNNQSSGDHNDWEESFRL